MCWTRDASEMRDVMEAPVGSCVRMALGRSLRSPSTHKTRTFGLAGGDLTYDVHALILTMFFRVTYWNPLSFWTIYIYSRMTR
jgi:hypothetical protein